MGYLYQFTGRYGIYRPVQYEIHFLAKNIIQLHNHKMSVQHDHKYFVQDQTTRGKEILLQANMEGDKNAKYGLAIALLCESNGEGIQLLLSILNQTNEKQLPPNK